MHRLFGHMHARVVRHYIQNWYVARFDSLPLEVLTVQVQLVSRCPAARGISAAATVTTSGAAAGRATVITATTVTVAIAATVPYRLLPPSQIGALQCSAHFQPLASGQAVKGAVLWSGRTCL